MIDTLLGKLRSVDAIDEETYRAALEDPLTIGGADADLAPDTGAVAVEPTAP
jgi:hypothetical protein